MSAFLLHLLDSFRHAHPEDREIVESAIADLFNEQDEYTIAVDFDGTLCRNAWPEIGEPIIRMIEAAKEAKRHGAKLILYTCREKKLLCEAVAWCAVRGLKFDAVNANLQSRIDKYGADCRKISYDELWDDLAADLAGFLPYGGNINE